MSEVIKSFTTNLKKLYKKSHIFNVKNHIVSIKISGYQFIQFGNDVCSTCV